MTTDREMPETSPIGRISRPSGKLAVVEAIGPPAPLFDECHGSSLSRGEVIGGQATVHKRSARLAVCVRLGFRPGLDGNEEQLVGQPLPKPRFRALCVPVLNVFSSVTICNESQDRPGTYRVDIASKFDRVNQKWALSSCYCMTSSVVPAKLSRRQIECRSSSTRMVCHFRCSEPSLRDWGDTRKPSLPGHQ
jgi:hypothetical protein